MSRFAFSCLCWSMVALAVGCKSASDTAPGSDATVPRPSAATVAQPSATSSALPKLESKQPVVELSGQSSWIVVPRGSREPRPIVLLWDGSTPDTRTVCQQLFDLAERAPFVLCHRARQGPTGPKASQELKDSLRTLKQRFGPHVAGGGVVFIATGTVVVPALSAIREEPSFFSRVVLVSDERVPWSTTLASLFSEHGGQRVLLACQSDACRQHATHPIHWLERHEVRARVVSVSETSGGPVLGLSRDDWRWLVQGDTRYPVHDPP